jgi:starch synthase
VSEPRKLTHAETGAPIWLTPGRRTRRPERRPSLRAALQWARTPFAGFARILREENCDAILVQDYEHARFDALYGLARMLRLPVFASFQGGDVTLSRLEARVRLRLLRACEGLIVASARERERLLHRYGIDPDRISAIPNPVDVDFWKPLDKARARRELGIPADALVVMNHGRIDIRRKGLDVLLDAWRMFSAGRSNARLVLIGSGQDRDAFAAMVAGAPDVQWLSRYVTDPEFVRLWLSAADIYVTLSRTEGMPVAPLEAMACGLPVVASDTHGLSDILQNGEAGGGILVPVENAPAASFALASLGDHMYYRAEMGESARRRAEASYGLNAVGQALAMLLRRTLA